MLEVSNPPKSIKIAFKYVFPDEVRVGSYLGGGYPVTDDCEGTSPEESYTEDYPVWALDYTMSLSGRVSEAYYLGLIPEGMTCREYFNKYKLPHIEVIDYE